MQRRRLPPATLPKKMTMRTLHALLVLPIVLSCQQQPTAQERAIPRPPTAAERELARSSGSFGLAFFRQVSTAEPAANVVVSPLSVSTTVGMTLNGAQGGTYDAIRSCLQVSGLTQQEINASYHSLTRLLLSMDPSVTMRLANSVWHRHTFPVEQSFLADLTQWFDARVAALDFSSSTASPTINAWVSDATNGRITSIVPAQIDPETMLYLINALYFKGTWTLRFDRSKTLDMPFRLPDGTSKSVPFMRMDAELMVGSHRGAQVLDMSYGGGYFRMSLVLPPEGTSVDAFIDALTPDRWNALVVSPVERRLPVAVPKFRLSFERQLRADLEAMGMGVAFTEFADFRRINPSERLLISSVKHKTFIQVDEEGTEAAAVTAVEIGVTSVPQDLRFDRPFLFAIRDRHTGAVLFYGKIVEPVWEE